MLPLISLLDGEINELRSIISVFCLLYCCFSDNDLENNANLNFEFFKESVAFILCQFRYIVFLQKADEKSSRMNQTQTRLVEREAGACRSLTTQDGDDDDDGKVRGSVLRNARDDICRCLNKQCLMSDRFAEFSLVYVSHVVRLPGQL